MLRLITPLLTLLAAAPALADDGWSIVNTPLPGAAQAVGAYQAGCLQGGAVLPLLGEGYQVMRPSRRRHFGHPATVGFVEALGRQAARRGWGRLLVGDMAQPRGGPMAFGHRSHQTGLDVDIWFHLHPPGPPLGRRQTEELPMLPVVDMAAFGLDYRRWTAHHGPLLKLAAGAPEVERIFVHPLIKQALCQSESDRRWLRKLRPWWGHDAHFHVRLGCPPGSGQCQPQPPVPAGDGCGADLDWWIEALRSPPAAPVEPRPQPPLPAACAVVLTADAAWPEAASR